MSDGLVRYLIPIIGLQVPEPWQVGRVVFHPGDRGRDLVGGATGLHSVFGSVDELLLRVRDSSLAEVAQGNSEDAIDEVQAAVDALRLLQFHRALGWPTWFGLDGGIYRSRIQYIIVGEQAGVGGQFRGDMPGTGLSKDAYDEWHGSPGFMFLSAALADPNASEGARRAAIGTTLFARAANEHRPHLRTLGAMSALDAWLGASGSGPQTRRLARYVSWFGCGVEYHDLCGRDRPSCAYLYLNPAKPKEDERLRAAKAWGDHYFSFEDGTRVEPDACSQWHDFTEAYRFRSEVAHGKTTMVPPKIADRAIYRISHHLAEPILAWLGEHRDDPLGDLDQALADLPEPPNWQTAVAKLDSVALTIRESRWPPPDPDTV